MKLAFVAIIIFFIGRETKEYNIRYDIEPNHFVDSFPINSYNIYKPVPLSDSDKVYRCGQSKIYHTSSSHGAFKRCKSKVYELSVKKAKELGMRRCKCRG